MIAGSSSGNVELWDILNVELLDIFTPVTTPFKSRSANQVITSNDNEKIQIISNVFRCSIDLPESQMITYDLPSRKFSDGSFSRDLTATSELIALKDENSIFVYSINANGLNESLATFKNKNWFESSPQ